MAGPNLAIRIVGDTKELLAALANAQGAIVALGPSVAKLQSTWTAASAKLVQDARNIVAAVDKVGTSTLTAGQAASSLTKLEQAMAQMGRTGQTIPPQMIATADALRKVGDAATQAEKPTSLLTAGIGKLAGIVTLAAVAKFGADLFAAAGRLQDFHERTDIGIESLQRLEVVAEQSGSTLEAVSGAVFQMGKRIAGGDDSAAAALKTLGLDFAAIRAMKPEAAFEIIGAALVGLDDPMTQADLGAKLFGRSVQELIPVFKNLTAATGPYITMSAEQVGLMDDLGDAYVAAKRSIVPFIVSQIDAKFHLSGTVVAIKSLIGIFKDIEHPTLKASSGFKAMVERTTELGNLAPSLESALATEAAVIKDLGEKTERTATHTRTQAAAFKLLHDETIPLAKGLGPLPGLVLDLSGELQALYPIAQNAGIVMGDFGTMVGTSLGRELDKGTVSIDAIVAATKRLPPEEKIAKVATLDWHTELKGLSSELANLAQVTGGALGPLAQMVSAMSAGYDGAKVFHGGLTDLGDVAEGFNKKGEKVPQTFGNYAAGATKAAAGVMTMIAALDAATQSSSKLQNSMSGAATGAQMGSAFGGWGALIGGIAGLLYGFSKSTGTVTQKMRDDFINAAGGLEELKRRAAEAGVSLGNLLVEYSRFSKEAIKNPREWAAEIDRVNKALQEHEERMRVLNEAAASLAVGFNAVALAMTAGYDAIGARVLAAQAAIEALSLAGKQKTPEWTAAVWELNAALEDQAAVAAKARQELIDVGLQALVAFNAGISRGDDFFTVLGSIGAGLDVLIQAHKDLGIGIEDAALQQLILSRQMMTANPQLIAGVVGLAQQFKALDALGMLNVDTFAAMQRTGSAMYLRLQDEAAKLGGGTREALLPMQGYLHEAEKAAKELGIPLDDNTQMLIDQSRELGIWKEAGKSSTDLMIAAVTTLNLTLDKLLVLLETRLPGAAATGAVQAKGSIGEITGSVDALGAHLGSLPWDATAEAAVSAMGRAKGAIDATTYGESPGGVTSLIEQMILCGKTATDLTPQMIACFAAIKTGGVDPLSGATSGGTKQGVAAVQQAIIELSRLLASQTPGMISHVAALKQTIEAMAGAAAGGKPGGIESAIKQLKLFASQLGHDAPEVSTLIQNWIDKLNAVAVAAGKAGTAVGTIPGTGGGEGFWLDPSKVKTGGGEVKTGTGPSAAAVAQAQTYADLAAAQANLADLNVRLAHWDTELAGRMMQAARGTTEEYVDRAVGAQRVQQAKNTVENLVAAIAAAKRDIEFFAAATRPANANLEGNPISPPGFAMGTGGRFLDFGRGTPAILHGKEKVVTEREGKAEQARMAGLERELKGLRADMARRDRTTVQAIKVAVSDAIALAPRRRA